MSQGSSCLMDQVFSVNVKLCHNTNFASVCITGDMIEFLLV